MKRFLRRIRPKTIETPPVNLTGADGEAWMEFSGLAVDGVRQTITRLMRTDPFPKRLVLTSAVRQEGVTYLSRAIGAILANDMNRNVCVVELNWWWPADYPKALAGQPGIAEVLTGDVSLEEAQIATGLAHLVLIPAGKLTYQNRSTVSHSENLADLMATLDEQFDHLVLDIPAVTAASDAILLASHGTGVCLVVHQGVTPVQRVKATLDDLDHLSILGVMMNQVKIATPSFLLDYILQE